MDYSAVQAPVWGVEFRRLPPLARPLRHVCLARPRNDDADEDLLEGNRGFQEAIYASLFTLSKGRESTSLRIVALRMVLEFLQASISRGSGPHLAPRRADACCNSHPV
jgi:hypothetical protein